MQYVHFKCVADEKMNPIEIAVEIFDDTHKYMVVLHPKSKKNAPPHWHFQGVPKGTVDVAYLITNINNCHSLKALDPKSRPCKRKTKHGDELGFQYMIRYGVQSVVVSKGFTPAELEVMVMASTEYVEALQAEGYVYLDKHLQLTGKPEDMHRRAKFLICRMYMDLDKCCPPNVSKLVVYWFGKLCKERNWKVDDVVSYISDKYF